MKQKYLNFGLFILFIFFLHCGSFSSNSYLNLPINVLHNFNGSDGATAKGSLVRGGNILYGRTASGGEFNKGTILKIDTTGDNFEVLYSFTAGVNNELGNKPHHDAMQLIGSTLYGAALYGANNDHNASDGNGALFSISTNGLNYQVVHEFHGGTTDGSNSHSCLLFINNVFYGMTALGGANDKGTIFKVNSDGSGFSILHSFQINTGSEPHGRLILGSDGITFYGMTREGGSAGKGVIFSFNPNSSVYTVLHEFQGGDSDGATTFHGYLVQNQRILYGLTTLGGSTNKGVIFRIDESGENFSLLHTFGMNPEDGSQPYGSLNLIGSFLYGTTYGGGSYNNGTVFRIQPDGTNYSRLASFNGPINGAFPIDNVISNEEETVLYGFTQAGGIYDPNLSFGENGYGTIFSITIPE